MSQATAISEKLPFAPTLSDQVAQALLARIELPPEAVLAPEFGVSRTVVREAISRLKHGGLLGFRQGSGVFVSIQPAIRPLKIDASVIESREAVLQIVELRRALESEAAAVAAQRRSSSQLAEIEVAFRAIDTEVAAGGCVMPDIALHRAIAQATGNPFFLKTLHFLTQYLTAATRVTRANEARRLQFMRQVRDEHSVIIEAIRRRDATACRDSRTPLPMPVLPEVLSNSARSGCSDAAPGSSSAASRRQRPSPTGRRAQAGSGVRPPRRPRLTPAPRHGRP